MQKCDLCYKGSNTDKALGKIGIIADTVVSLDAIKNGKQNGSLVDVSFSTFHAVKDLSTQEDGEKADYGTNCDVESAGIIPDMKQVKSSVYQNPQVEQRSST